MKWFLLIGFTFLVSVPCIGQSTVSPSPKLENTLLYGFGYFGHYKFTPKWGLHSEAQFRMDGEVKFAFQNLFRTGAIRYLKPNLYVIGGYAFLTTHSEKFGDYFKEHRLFEQIAYSNKSGRFTFINRFRVEQRFVEKLKFSPAREPVTDDYKYGNRLRFFNRTIYHLTKNPEASNVMFVALQDEVFLNVAAPDLNRNLFDQNRFLLVFGVYKNRHTILETGYVHVFLNPYKTDNIMVHSLHFAIIQTLDFNAKK